MSCCRHVSVFYFFMSESPWCYQQIQKFDWFTNCEEPVGRLQPIRAQDKGERRKHSTVDSLTCSDPYHYNIIWSHQLKDLWVLFMSNTSLCTSSIITSSYLDSYSICLSLCTVLYEIFRPDNKPLTLMLPVNSSVQEVMSAIVKPGGDHVLVKMNSTGGETDIE